MDTQKTLTRTQKRNIFFGVMIIIPIIIFILFYGVINLNTILMAFRKYEAAESGYGYDISFAGLENFKIVIKMLAYKDNWMMLRNSAVLWALKLLIGLPVSLIFSYFVIS